MAASPPLLRVAMKIKATIACSVLAVVTAGWRAANLILGRVGNKVAIVAVRTTEAR